jgi:LysM repeat protein
MRKHTLSRFLVLGLLAVGLTGCFRQAEEPFSTLPPAQLAPTTAQQQPTTDPAGGAGVIITTAPTESDTTPTDVPLVVTVEATTNPLLLAPLNGSTSTPLPTPTLDPSTDLMGGGSGGMLGDLIIVTNTPTIGPSPTSDLLPTPTDAFFGTEDGTAQPAGGAVNPECLYVVRSGETLLGIANRNGVTVSALREANNITGDLIRVGDELVLPGCDAPPVTPTPTVPATPAPEGFESYTVQRGDTLFSIAQRYGTSVQAIVDANSLSNPNALAIGDVLLIPQD